MVKTPICSFCAKTGTLCPNCSARFNKGEISEKDILTSKALARLEKKYPNLSKAQLKQTISADDIVILVVNRVMKDTIDQHPEIHDIIKGELKVRQVESVIFEKNLKETISALFYPVEVQGVNQIFIPDGTKELKILLKGDISLLPISLETLQLISEKITDSLIRIETVA